MGLYVISNNNGFAINRSYGVRNKAGVLGSYWFIANPPNQTNVKLKIANLGLQTSEGHYYYMDNSEWGVYDKSINFTVILPNNWCNETDINRDGVVDIGNLNRPCQNYDAKNCTIQNYFCNWADIDRNVFVGFNDMLKLSQNYGKVNCIN